MPSSSALTLPFYNPTGSKYQSTGLLHVVTITGINGLATGNTAIMTVPANYIAVVDSLVVRVTAVTGSATTGAVSLVNLTDTADVIANTTLTSLVTAGLMTKLSPAAAAPVVPAAKVIALTIGTAYTVASVVTLSVDLRVNLVKA